VAILDADVQKEFDRFRPTRKPILLGEVQIIDTVQSANVTTTYRTAQHTHYVNRPTWNIPEHAKFPLPDQYQTLLDSSPVWLQQSLRVLEGDLIREQQIEIDTGREELLDEQVVSTRRVVYRDPAIVVGNYVFAGWGESEICDQEQRIQNKQVVKDKKSKALVARQYRWCSYGVALLGRRILMGHTADSESRNPVVASRRFIDGSEQPSSLLRS
jgi:hypothetical protein